MKKFSSVLIISGTGSIILALIIFIITFYPVILVELNYQTNLLPRQSNIKKDIIPKDLEFGIVVPKIGANAKIVAEVNPYDNKEYQLALTAGVAHAKGTVFPGQVGNMFLFSHSSVNFYEANRYNSIFYLLDKMEKGDEIDLYYKGEKFTYRVTDKKIVLASDVKYLLGNGTKKIVTLMTCWPKGTSWKRLLVLGELATP